MVFEGVTTTVTITFFATNPNGEMKLQPVTTL